MFKDAVGNILSEGDLVTIGLGLGQTTVGTVQKTDSVLSSNPNAQPMIHVQVIFTLPSAPNGLVPGVIKAAQPAPQISQ